MQYIEVYYNKKVEKKHKHTNIMHYIEVYYNKKVENTLTLCSTFNCNVRKKHANIMQYREVYYKR